MNGGRQMTAFRYARAQEVSIKKHPELNESWVRDRIREDPSILGLGELEVKDVERMLPKAGRLDLLLAHPETGKRYEVELMLGATDESHIIRCIEYWDVESKRYPQYDHCAVLIAEDVTSRFLNVIGLFNGHIPMIALKMTALQIGDQLVLQFVKVVDERVLGEDDEGGDEPPANRQYWEERGSKASVAIADECLGILREVVDGLELKYNRHYIGLAERGVAHNFVTFRPKREFVRVSARIGDTDAWAGRLEDAGLVVLEGGRRRGALIFRMEKGDAQKYHALLKELFTAAYGSNEE
jgi:hypothetical protein